MKLLNLVLGIMLSTSLALACKGGGQMAIKDSSGKQIGVILKGTTFQIIPIQGQYAIKSGNITSSGQVVKKFVEFGVSAKLIAADSSLFARNSILNFSIIDGSGKKMGDFSLPFFKLTMIAKTPGCGGELKPIQ